MRLGLRLAALAIVFVTLVLWFFGGPNLGWTKTTVTEMRVDPVTTIEYPVTEPRFLPGVDFLGAGFLAGAALFGISMFFRRK